MAKKESKNENKVKKHFFKDFKAELKKVIWPTPKQLVNNTVAVITIVLITAVIVFVLDLAFESLNKYGVDKIKESIQTIESTTDENTTTETNEATDNTATESGNTANEEQSSTNETTETENSSENNVE